MYKMILLIFSLFIQHNLTQYTQQSCMQLCDVHTVNADYETCVKQCSGNYYENKFDTLQGEETVGTCCYKYLMIYGGEKFCFSFKLSTILCLSNVSNSRLFTDTDDKL
jgi:hypothetical protein